ncbi:MAG: 50S ribosomal protein L11 methyltransferase [Armatimonadota bacterium]
MYSVRVDTLPDVRVPREFEPLVRQARGVVVKEASARPAEAFALQRDGYVVALTGQWRYVDAMMRYVHRRRRDLVERSALAHIANRYRRLQAREAALRDAVARVMVVVEGERLWRVSDHPDIAGILDWLDPADARLADRPFLLPVRRLQRILTDRRRAAEGLYVRALGARITILPHVFVPQDENVVNLLADRLRLPEAATVLDMGTGTGVLAFVAANAGAARVIATDNSPYAVRNARLNAERLGLTDRVHVRGPADLFDAVADERFDVVIFNAPWVCGEAKTLYEAAIYDEGFRVLRRFLAQVAAFLTDDGRVLLIYGDISELTGQGSLTLLRELVDRNRLRIVGDYWVARRARLLGARERVHLFELVRKPTAEVP